MIYREGVCGLVFSPDQKEIVLIKREDCGILYLPGGHIEPGESKENAVKREVREETGLDIKIIGFVGTYDFRVFRNHPFFWSREYVYAGISERGTLRTNEEATRVEYFAIEAIPKSLPYYQREYITDGALGKTNVSPIIQGIELSGLFSLLTTNPGLLKKPLKILRKLIKNQ